MKNYFLFLILFNYCISFSQNSPSLDKIKLEIQKDFSKVDKKRPLDLIPFCVKGKWGYLDRKTMLEVVKPKFDNLSFCNYDFNIYYKDFFIKVNSSDLSMMIENNDDAIMDGTDYSKSDIQVISSDNGYKGFSVDENGKLVSYSKLYYHDSNHFWNISPFKNQDKYYAIVTLNGNKGIIDTDGNPVALFNFNYKGIVRNPHADNSKTTWFLVTGLDGKYSFVNFEGDFKLKNEVIYYPFMSDNAAGYSLLRTEKKWAVLDLHSMEWKIKPQSKIKFSEMNYSYNFKGTKNSDDYENRGLMKVFILNDFPNKKYYTDFDGKKYIPKKYL